MSPLKARVIFACMKFTKYAAAESLLSFRMMPLFDELVLIIVKNGRAAVEFVRPTVGDTTVGERPTVPDTQATRALGLE